jgi:uncharacterized membrane protein
LIERYRPIDFVGLFLACSFIAFMVWRVAWPSWRMREQLEQSFERDVQLVHSSSFVQMTDGILTAYFVLLALLGASALLTGIAITHYLTILNDCQLVIAPHR